MVAAEVSFRVGQLTFSSSRVTSTIDACARSLRYDDDRRALPATRIGEQR